MWRDGKCERQIIVRQDDKIINMATLVEPHLEIKIHRRTIGIIDINYNLYAVTCPLVIAPALQQNLHLLRTVSKILSFDLVDVHI